MTFQELQKILDKYPFLYPIIQERQLNTLRFTFEDYTGFDYAKSTRIIFVMVNGTVLNLLYFPRTIDELIKHNGKPRFLVWCAPDNTVHVYKCRSRKCKSSKLDAYADPMTCKDAIAFDVTLVGTARVMKVLPEGVLLEGFCKHVDGSSRRHTFYAKFIDFTNPQDTHLPEANYSQGHWTFLRKFSE